MTVSPNDSEDIQDRLRAGLRDALRSRDGIATLALRSALAAIANAEAVDALPVDSKPSVGQHFAGAVAGLGAAETRRRELTDDQTLAIVRSEIIDRQAAATDYAATGNADRAERQRAEAHALLHALET